MTFTHWSSVATPPAFSNVQMSAATARAGVRRLARRSVVQSRRNAGSVTVRAVAAPRNRARHSRGIYFEYGDYSENSVRVGATHGTEKLSRTTRTNLRAISDSQDVPGVEVKFIRDIRDTADGTHPGLISDADSQNKTALIATAFPLVAVALLVGIGAFYKDDISSFLMWFTGYVESLGPAGPASFMTLYVLLEILAVPAIPLTMSAGAIFGPAQGTAIVSISATIAATASFLIARYLFRDKVRDLAIRYPKFTAIDNAIGEDSFRVVALLRLSPLTPFALSNYLYGLTSVKTKPYVLASWIGMLPGTFAYVSAGSVGRTMMEAGAGGGANDFGYTHALQIGGGFALALVSGSYVAKLASDALKDVEEEMNAIEEKQEATEDAW